MLHKISYLKYNQYINYVILAYAFVLPLSRAGISFFTALLILLWFLEGNFKRKIELLKNNKVILALTVFLIFNLISTLWTNDKLETLDYIKKYWYFLPSLVIFTSIKKSYIPKALSAFILGMFISEVISYGVYFEIWEFKHAIPENPSPFMHHIEYSVFLAFTALVLLSRIFNEKDVKYKLIYMFFFMTISGNLFLTAGRTGQLAFIIGLFVLAMTHFKNKAKAVFIFLFLSVLVLGVAFNFSTTFHDRIIMGQESLVNAIEVEDYCTSWGSRVGASIVAKDIIVEHPLIGAGIIDNMEEFYYLIDTKYPKMECMKEFLMHMHNQYIQIFTELGLIGLIIFLSIFYSIGKIRLNNRTYTHVQYVYIAILLFSFISEVIFHRQFSMALFALIVGLLLAQQRIENEI